MKLPFSTLLVSVILFSEGAIASCPPGALHVIDLSAETLQDAQDLVAKKSNPIKKTVLFDSPNHGATVEVEGVPKSVVVHPYEQGEIFRYYMTSPEILTKVLDAKYLESGHVPYVIVTPGIEKQYFYDLEGAFMTKPEFPPERVGLERDPNMSYIDFTLKPGYGVLSLEPGIFLIPGKPRFPDWIEAEFLKWKKSGATEYPAQYAKAFKRIELYQHKSKLIVPIQIKEYKQNGIVRKFQ